MTGKEKCRLLRQIRKEIAEANNVVFLSADCNNDADCAGTCALCDAEVQWLDAELLRKAAAGHKLTLKGLSLDTFSFSINSCETSREPAHMVEKDLDLSVGHIHVAQPSNGGSRERKPTPSYAEVMLKLMELGLSTKSETEGKYCRSIATKADWKTEPVPERTASFKLHLPLSYEELVSLGHGFVPWNMDQKWFYYYENGKLFFHRSWTGYCYYVITLDLKEFNHDVLIYLYEDTTAEDAISNARSYLGDMIKSFARNELHKESALQHRYKMFDIHAHVLPGLDDGAANLNMAFEMLQTAYKQGVRDIVCSSHSWGNISQYKKQLAILQSYMAKKGLKLDLHQGCEIACSAENMTSVLMKLKSGLLPTMCGKKYVMLEFHPSVSATELIKCVKQIVALNEYRIIIAHIERYSNLAKDESAIKILKEWGCFFQVNAYSLVEEKKESVRDFANKLLANKQVDFLGSDAHRMDHRPPIVASGVRHVYKTCDDNYAQDVCYRNAQKFLLEK